MDKTTSYPGELYTFEDGMRIGLRSVSKSGPPTIDIHFLGEEYKLKLKFLDNNEYQLRKS